MGAVSASLISGLTESPLDIAQSRDGGACSFVLVLLPTPLLSDEELVDCRDSSKKVFSGTVRCTVASKEEFGACFCRCRTSGSACRRKGAKMHSHEKQNLTQEPHLQVSSCVGPSTCQSPHQHWRVREIEQLAYRLSETNLNALHTTPQTRRSNPELPDNSDMQLCHINISMYHINISYQDSSRCPLNN
eukprot:SAG31_NODE_2657_length_5286_cov_7.817235_3_plen_189_part_00